MSVYPSFPENPDPGDTFPAAPESGDAVWTYVSDQVGWVKTVINLQGPYGDAIWPGRIISVPAQPEV
jgi:hypothetical protein